MKKSFVTDAINLKNYPLSDNDSIVVMFSKTKGLMRAVAKGAKRPKSKLGARTQMFIANKMMLLQGKNLDTIAQAESINTFSKIRYDLDKLTYSMYLAELVNTFCSNEYNKDENYQEIYNLIFQAYEKIATAEKKEEVILASLKFQLKLMNILGWGLDFNNCSICQCKLEFKQDESAFFSYAEGSFLCKECAKKSTSGIKIHNKIRLFLSEISKKDYSEATKYDKLVNLFVLEKCFGFVKKYIDNLTNKRTKVFEVLKEAL